MSSAQLGAQVAFLAKFGKKDPAGGSHGHDAPSKMELFLAKKKEAPPLDPSSQKAPTIPKMEVPAPLSLPIETTEWSPAIHGVLDPEEAKAIKEYSDTAYHAWNGALRKAHMEIIPEHIQKKIDLIKSGLQKLPSYHGTLYRGSGGDVYEHYKIAVGEVLCDPAFFSSSKLEEVTGDFLARAEVFPLVLFIIESKGGGKDVAGYAVDCEAEVMFPPGTKFLINKVEIDMWGTHEVWIEEIVDDEPSKPAAVDGDDSIEPSPELPLPVEEETDSEEETPEEGGGVTSASPNRAEVEQTQESSISPPIQPTNIGEDETVLDVVPSPGETVPVLPLEQQPVADSPSEMGSQWIGGRRRSARLQPQMGTVYVKGLRRSARLAAASS